MKVNGKNKPSKGNGVKSNALAKPGDPLVNQRGEQLTEERDNAPSAVEIKTITEPKDYKPAHRTVLKELPAPVKAMNLVAVIFMYTLYGIGDNELSEAIGISIDDIIKVRETRAYGETFDTMMKEFISANSEFMECRIAAYSGGALSKVASLSQNGKKEETQLAASRDILDRGGFRPQDQLSKSQSPMNELRITITNTSENIEADIELQ